VRIAMRKDRHVVDQTFHVRNVNALHSRFQEFLKPFRGPAKWNLQRYVAWFILRACGARTCIPRSASDGRSRDTGVVPTRSRHSLSTNRLCRNCHLEKMGVTVTNFTHHPKID
jgi:hypothetical protein